MYEITNVQCGDNSQLFLTNNGELYSCGSNRYARWSASVPLITIPRFQPFPSLIGRILTNAHPPFLRILSLSTAQPWDKLRVCCGAQMSVTYREKLENVKHEGRESYWGGETTPCDAYDLSSIEKQLMRTEVYRNATGVEHLMRLSSRDQVFDGSYCDRAKNATIRSKLAFNDRRYADV